MKKTISLFLALVMCLLLVACGDGSEDSIQSETPEANAEIDLDQVRAALAGSSRDIWIWQDGSSATIYNFADDGRVTQGSMLGSAQLPNVEGTYEVTEEGIILTNSSGSSKKVLTYTYENGKLRLFDGGKEFEFSPG